MIFRPFTSLVPVAKVEAELYAYALNRSAIGAKVRVQAAIGGKLIWQMREINNGHGAGGASLLAHFGLGAATNIDQVRIEWPSGIVQTLTNVSPKQILTVKEHQPGNSGVPSFTGISRAADGAVDLSVSGNPGLIYVLEASTNLVNWTKLGACSNVTGALSFADSKATNYVTRFYRVSIP